MDKRTFKRIKMLHEEGMAIKGAIVVLIDLCKSSDEAAEKIEELIFWSADSNITLTAYDRGFCDSLKSMNLDARALSDLLSLRKESRDYDPPT